MKTIDLNCDVGEGTGNDQLLMPYISSCSIACGGHFGTKNSIRETIDLALSNNVKVGAHPAYSDPDNFGRKSIQISNKNLQDSLRKQLDLFFSISSITNHIKPHGALYNDLFNDTEKAEAVVEVFVEYGKSFKIYCAPNSQLGKASHNAGFGVIYEGFGDRAYTKNGGLLARNQTGALLKTKETIAKQFIQIVQQSKVLSIEGEIIPLEVQTICLHGDGENVIEHLHFLVKELNKNNICVESS